MGENLQRQYTRLYFAVNLPELFKENSYYKAPQICSVNKEYIYTMLLGFKVFKNYPKNKNIRARVKPEKEVKKENYF